MSEQPPRIPPTEAELVELVRAIDVRAPEQLHARIQTLVDERTAAQERRRWTILQPRRALLAPLAGAVALAAVAVALLVGGGSGTPSLPSVQSASASTLGPATMHAPVESKRNRAQLSAAVDGVAFPYWEESFGLRSVGSRADRVSGRPLRTVFYADARGRRIGYGILGGSPPPALNGGVAVRRGGTVYRLLKLDGANVVVWLRHGRLCIVSATKVDGPALLRLASWDEAGATPA
jgi:hypothetical protein